MKKQFMARVSLLIYFAILFLLGNMMAKTSSSSLSDSISSFSSVEQTILSHNSIQKLIQSKEEPVSIETLLKMHDAIKRFELDSLAITYEYDIALNYFYNDSLSKALLYTTKSISSFIPSNPNYDLLSQAHNLDGILNMEMGNFSKAIDGFTASMETYMLYEPSRVTYPIANLSNVYYLIGDIENAIKYTKEAVKHTKQMKGNEFYYNYGYDCVKLSGWFDELNEADSATYYLQKSLALVANLDTVKTSNRSLVTMVNEQSFKYYLKRNNTKTAKEYLNKVLNNSSDLSNLKLQMLKAQFDIAIGDKKNLNKFLDHRFDNNASIEEKIEFLKFKLDFHKNNYDYKKALSAYEELQDLKTNDAKINQQQYANYAYAQFETFEKEKEIQRLTKLREITNLKLQRQKAVYFAVFALIVGLLSALFFYYYFRFQRNDRFNKQLEKEVKKKTNALLKLNNVLTNNNEELEQFNYILSHDLKEPIRSIVSFSNLIYRKANKDKDKDKEIKEFSCFITNAGKQLSLLLEGISEFQFSNKLTIKKEQINLSEIILNFKKINTQFIKENNVLIMEDGLSEIYSSKVGLFIILKNLIENGIKYNNSVQPTVWISMQEKENDYSIFVKDNGIGLQKIYYDQIFTMFKRLQNRKVYQGSGLGLAICHKVALKLNGNIEVLESIVGKGTTFKLTLKKGKNKKTPALNNQMEDIALMDASI